MIAAVQIILGAMTAWFTASFVNDFFRSSRRALGSRVYAISSVGFATNFFDALGIGSFAPQTAFFKFFGWVEDRHIPGTLNVANTVPVVLQAFIFLNVVRVDTLTLMGMLIAAPMGAVIGAGIVSRLPERHIRIGLGIALLAVGLFLFAGLMEWYPSAGEAAGLRGWKLVLAVTVSFILGSLHSIGIGYYAPCMALIYSLGMNPRAAFPIMMGAAAMLMPAASLKFVRKKAYDNLTAMVITLAGIPGVAAAAYLVTSLPLKALKWVVLTVMIYTAFIMFRSASRRDPTRVRSKPGFAGPQSL